MIFQYQHPLGGAYVGSKAWFAEISRDSAIVTPFYPVGGWSGSVNQAFPWVYGAGAPVLGCPRETCMKMQTALRSPANFITETETETETTHTIGSLGEAAISTYKQVST